MGSTRFPSVLWVHVLWKLGLHCRSLGGRTLMGQTVLKIQLGH